MTVKKINKRNGLNSMELSIFLNERYSDTPRKWPVLKDKYGYSMLNQRVAKIKCTCDPALLYPIGFPIPAVFINLITQVLS